LLPFVDGSGVEGTPNCENQTQAKINLLELLCEGCYGKRSTTEWPMWKGGNSRLNFMQNKFTPQVEERVGQLLENSGHPTPAKTLRGRRQKHWHHWWV